MADNYLRRREGGVVSGGGLSRRLGSLLVQWIMWGLI